MPSLPVSAAAASDRLVSLPPRSFPKAAIATLCVALSLVFAGASAASLSSRLQHDLQLEHAHDNHDGPLAFVIVDDHHGGGNELPVDPDRQDPGTDPEDSPGGHSHADGPAGFVAAAFVGTSEMSARDLRLDSGSDAPLRGWPPKGPERPPRPLTTRA